MYYVSSALNSLQSRERVKARRWLAGASSLALTMAFATAGLAQNSEPPTPSGQATPPAAVPAPQAAPDNGAQIGEVIVTARRVQEKLQDIPASVSAVTGEQVARMATLSDLQSMVSGVTFETFGPIPTVGIRGFGNRTSAGVTTISTVGIFEDGVFVAPPLATLINRVDTDRVEVAKGPQSTLYGRSSFTGAINTVSNDPAHTLSGYLEGGGGGSSVHGEGLWDVRGAVSVPINDTLSIRFFGLREERDGYTYDSVTKNRGDGYDRTIGRVKVLWQPTDNFTARVTGTVIHDNEPLGVVHSGRTSPPLGQSVIFGDPFNPAVQAAQTFGKTVWDASYVLPQTGKTSGAEGTVDLRYKTPIGEFASLTDYQHASQELRLSLDLTPLSIANGDTPFVENRWSQEFRLSNQIGRLHYIVGLYYLQTSDRQSGGKLLNMQKPFVTFGPGALLYDLAGFKAIYEPVDTNTQAYAAFGQLGYDITDKLNLTVGIRQGRDRLSGLTSETILTRTNFLIPAVPPVERQGTFDATTGSANLSYKIQPNVIGYVSYSRGDSPGGLNTGATAAVNYLPQKVDAYEVGLKSQLLNRRLQLNVALFDNEYSQLQLTQDIFYNGALNPLVTNAANARGRGIDLDSIAVLSKNWRFGLQYTYVDSKITSYTIPPAPAPQVDLTGVPLVRSPHNSANVSATYTKEIGPGKLELTAEETYTSAYTNDYQGVPAGTAYPGIPGVLAPGITTSQVLALYRTPGYALTNLNASYSWNQWELSAYVRNLTNHQYIAAVIAFDTVSYPQEVPGEPQTFGASLKYKF